MTARTTNIAAEVAKAVAVIVVAAAAGYLVGVGLAKARHVSGSGANLIDPAAAAKAGRDSTTAAQPQTSTQQQSTTSSPAASSSPKGTRPITASDSISLPDGRLALVSGELLYASKPEARRRNRARVTLQLRFTNSTDDELSLPKLVLFTNGDSIDASSTGTSLSQPIPAGGSGAGEVRYEISGEDTKALTERGSAKLLVGDQSMGLRIGS